MSGMPVVQLPSAGVVGGRPRKEGVFDTGILKSGTAFGVVLTLFSDFSSFNVAPTNGYTKQLGRDTNLAGGGTRGLPKNHHLFWYEWRMKVRPVGADLSAVANKGVTEQCHRYVGLSSVEYNFTQTTLITVQADELPAGSGAAWGHTTHSDTAMFGPNCIPDKRGKIVTITGKPVSINELQDFDVKIRTPEGAFSPTVDLFVTVYLEGLLVRGIVG